jgi:Spy/CpxP family protein refolding chaperone
MEWMKGWKRTIGMAALATGLLATAAATSAGAFGGHCRHGGRDGGRGGPSTARLEHRLERLVLSADVRAKALAIVDASRSEDRALREQTQAAREELRASLSAGGEPDRNALDAQIERIGALETEHHKQFLHTLIAVGAVLPDAQRAQWFEPPHHRGDRDGRPTR